MYYSAAGTAYTTGSALKIYRKRSENPDTPLKVSDLDLDNNYQSPAGYCAAMECARLRAR